jgi:hypothetical protein
MSVQIDPQIRVNWIAASAEYLDAEWQHVDCCAVPQPPADPQPPAIEDDEWCPGRCIP